MKTEKELREMVDDMIFIRLSANSSGVIDADTCDGCSAPACYRCVKLYGIDFSEISCNNVGEYEFFEEREAAIRRALEVLDAVYNNIITILL